MTYNPNKTPNELAEANKKIADCMTLARRALKEATNISEEFGITFRWTGPEDAYQMGGEYLPIAWTSSTDICEDGGYSGWTSSSSRC